MRQDTQLLGEYLKKTLKIKCVSPKDLESSDFRDNFLDNMRKKLYDLCTQGSGWILFGSIIFIKILPLFL